MEKFLFPTKEMYLSEHDKYGNSRRMAGLSRHFRRIHQQNNLHLLDGMKFSLNHELPLLLPYENTENWTDIIPFSKRRRHTGENIAVHCFERDYLFESFWSQLDKTIYSLQDYSAVFTPDFTLYVDAPEPVNRWNVYKSRFCGARLQLDGYDVVPTFGYSDATSLNWTLEGLPLHSVLGVSGTGLKQCSAKLKLFQYAMRRAEEELSPLLFYVYGEPVDVPSVTTEIRFIPTQYSKTTHK